MHLQPAKAPHIRFKESVHTLFTDVIIALLPLYAMAFFYYGGRTLIMALAAAAVCFLLDILCRKMAGKVIKINDFSAVITGLLIPLMLPASVPYYVVIAACAFAILIAKHPFGGLGYNLFNPAAAGIAFVTVCWPKEIFRYPKPFEKIPLILNNPVELFSSPAAALKVNGAPSGDLLQYFLGNSLGPIGATSILVILSCMFFLIYRRTISWHIPVSALAAAAVFSLLFPRVSISLLNSTVYELFAGTLVFGAAFVATDPVTSPSFPIAKIIYGAGIGLLTMLLRWFGGFEEGFIFALLMMNTLSFALDRLAIWLRFDLNSGRVPIRRVKAAAKGFIARREHKKIYIDTSAEPITEPEEEQEEAQKEEATVQSKGGRNV